MAAVITPPPGQTSLMETTPSNELVINCAVQRKQLNRAEHNQFLFSSEAHPQRRDWHTDTGRRQLRREWLLFLEDGCSLVITCYLFIFLQLDENVDASSANAVSDKPGLATVSYMSRCHLSVRKHPVNTALPRTATYLGASWSSLSVLGASCKQRLTSPQTSDFHIVIMSGDWIERGGDTAPIERRRRLGYCSALSASGS